MSNTTLEGLVSNGKTKEAIELLINLIEELHSEHRSTLTQLLGRYSSNSKTERNQLEERTVTSIENNRINATFLNVLTDVRDEIQSKIHFFKPIPKEVGEKEILSDFLTTVLSKKYEKIAHYAHGNTFIYFSAKEKHSGLDVMIMVLKSSDIKSVMDSNYLHRIAQLKHRNLIQLLDVNFLSYPFYLITEYVSGIDLKTLMKNIGPLPMHNAKRLLLIIGDVMNTLKLKKFPYAGIRPSKILIDHELEPEISPFDILGVDNDKRLLRSFIEDCHYFASEKLYDFSINTKPDAVDKANQFCLAALGYEMITGQKLFEGANVSDILLIRHRFFTDVEYRKTKLAHPRLTNRMASIFKKMLNEDPQKRYDDIPTALKEIAKVRVPMNSDEDKVFKSYRRCLNDTDGFIDVFYENLFAQPGMASKKPLDKEKGREYLSHKFFIDIHLVFGVENFDAFLEKLATMEQGEINPYEEYTLFLDAFIQTVSQCDPRWDTHRDIEKAWNNIKTNVLSQLQNYLPEPETVSNFTDKIDTEDSNTAPANEKEQPLLVNNTGTSTSDTLNDYSATTDNEGNIVMTKIETQFDPDKA